MNLLRQRYRAWIVPYAEETLDARRRAKLEAWLARDPILAAEAEAERRVVTRLRAVAQSSEAAPGAQNLWPGIRSRLEARRSPLRPLMLVGGLSAAATSLAWAALWGPLHRPATPAPPAIVAANTGNPTVIVIGPTSRRNLEHAGHRTRRNSDHLARRLAPSTLGPDRGVGQPGPTDEGRLAHSDAAPVEDGGTETPSPASHEANRFHLATSVRPVEHGVDANAPTGLNTVTPPEDTPVPGTGGTAAERAGSPESEDGVSGTPIPVAAPDRASPERSGERRTRRRRHSHHATDSKPAVGEQEGARDSDGTAVPPKSAPKPID